MPQFHLPRIVLSLLLLTFMLAACGNEDESDRTFAPEARSGTEAPTATAVATDTPRPQNRQPGESSTSVDDPGALFDQTGPAKVVTSGIATWAVVDLESGDARELKGKRGPATIAATSLDGSLTLEIDRTSEPVTIRLYASDGSKTKTWRPEQDATPEASPIASGQAIRAGDRIAWNQDGRSAIVSIADVGVFLTGKNLKMRPVAAGAGATVTSITWSPSGQSIALGLWRNQETAGEIVTVNTSALDGLGTSVLRLSDGDGRFVRSLGWGAEQVGLVYALRSVSADFSLANDLYFLPRFGEPMRLLASAGIAAPAAVVDQVAIAGNGSTVAFTIQVPGEVGLRFHSVWVTDALAPAPVQADTTGLRRVVELAWGPDGLFVSGVRRAQTDESVFQVATVEQVSKSEPAVLAEIRSDATPLASPAASPRSGTPVS
jgi:hypothetical protein